MKNIHKQLADGAIAVTATRRLKRYLLAQYGAYQLQLGSQAWATPAIQSWDEWITLQWKWVSQGDMELDGKIVLDEYQELQLWEKVIQQAMLTDQALLQTAAAAAAARDAWRLIHEWHVPLSSLANSHIEDTEAFYGWAREFVALTGRNGWLSLSELYGLLEGQSKANCRPGQALLFVGFDHWTTAQRSLLDKQRAAGVHVETVAMPKLNRQTVVAPCSDRREEFESAAVWAQQLLHRGVAGTIGIIVDDLPKLRDQAEIVFDQVLHPGGSLSQDNERRRAFHVSYGRKLSDYPVVASALTVLGFIDGMRPLQHATRLLHTPFLSGGVPEASVRAQIDLELRRRGWENVSISGLARFVRDRRFPAGQLVDCLTRAERISPPGRQSPFTWAGFFIDWLSLFGWPGERELNSVEYQAVQAFRELMSQFARLTVVKPEIDAGEAIARVEQLARMRVFQEKSEHAPVQIMGVLEASGIQFSHLWITGMSDQAWPAPVAPNPFIPFGLQKRLGLPGAVAELELECCKQITSRLIDSAAYTTVSYPRQHEEQVFNVSPLFGDFPASNQRQPVPGLARLMFRQRPEMEVIKDQTGTVLGADAARGGAGIFNDQAACPFRAFAHHRLGARGMPQVEAGLSAAERGTLVHECIAGLWREIESSDELKTLSAREQTNVLTRHINDAVSKLARRDSSRFRREILNIEKQGLLTLLQEWMMVERNRGAFRVIQIEQKVKTSFAGIDITFRIDRMDEWGDGQRALIDYKTGGQVNVDHWLGVRPHDPQLPLYLLCAGDEISVLAYARLRRGGCGFKGVAKTKCFAEGVGERGDWDELMDGWRRTLTRLAGEFRAGLARVDPKDKKVCQTCDVTAFCRIYDARRELTRDE